MIEFVIPGRPQPAGSKQAIPFQRQNGKLGVALRDGTEESAKRHAAWRERVSLYAAQAMKGASPLEGAIRLVVCFGFARPAGHWLKSGALAKGARIHHTTYPDLDKLERSLKDALTGIVWLDDKQVIEHRTTKAYTGMDATDVQVEEVEVPSVESRYKHPELFRAEI